MKLAIITGGSRGLGEAIKNNLKEDGYEIYDLSRSGTGEDHISCDLGNFEESQEAISELFYKLQDRIWNDILFFNNAGVVSPIKNGTSLNDREIHQNLTVNITSAIALIVKFLNRFENQNCRKIIVNISSGAAMKGFPGWSLYCASKAAVENFIRSIAEEQKLKDSPVLAINYSPGVMDTEMQSEIRESDEAHFPMKEKFIELKHSGSLRTAEYVAKHILSLLSDDMVNGERYSVS